MTKIVTLAGFVGSALGMPALGIVGDKLAASPADLATKAVQELAVGSAQMVLAVVCVAFAVAIIVQFVFQNRERAKMWTGIQAMQERNVAEIARREDSLKRLLERNIETREKLTETLGAMHQSIEVCHRTRP